MLNYYSCWVGGCVGGQWVVGGSEKKKLMLYSTPVEIEVEVGVELGNNGYAFHRQISPPFNFSKCVTAFPCSLI